MKINIKRRCRCRSNGQHKDTALLLIICRNTHYGQEGKSEDLGTLTPGTADWLLGHITFGGHGLGERDFQELQ